MSSTPTYADVAAARAALAALWSKRAEYAGRRVGVICSGGNASEAELAEVLRA
jgi:threonine dehydratase